MRWSSKLLGLVFACALTPALAQTLGAPVGAVGTSVPGQLPGTATNDNATAGNVGEYMQSVVSFSAPVALSNGAPTTITSLALTPGDWDVFWTGGITTDPTTNITRYYASLSLTNNAADTAYLADNLYPVLGVVNSSSAIPSTSIGMRRVSVATTTTVFGIVRCNFTISTCSGFGNLQARRTR